MDRKKLVMLNDAIYYPFINLPNDSWFRTSILFWDTINPIVPREIYYAMDSRSLLKVLEANNAARPIYPEEISLGSKANVFTESVLGYAEGFLKQVDPSERTGSYSKIHRVKMPWELQKELEQMTFLQVIPDDYDWFYLYTPLANIFMGELARFLANDKGMIPLTDQNESGEYIFGLPEKQIQSKSIFETMSSWFKQSEEEGERDEYSVRQIALRFLFQKILPTPSAGFDIEALLKIKEDNRELLYNFRNSFRAVVDRINQEQSKSEVLEELHRYSDKIQADSLKLKEVFSDYDDDITFSDFGAFLSIEKPIKLLTTLGLTTAGFAVSPLFFVGVILFAGFEGLRGRHELRKGIQKSLRECEGAYVFKLRQELSQYRNSGIE